jgi:hypothetical protein
VLTKALAKKVNFFARTSAKQRQANFEDLAKPTWNIASGYVVARSF